jgi:hypothetical protein
MWCPLPIGPPPAAVVPDDGVTRRCQQRRHAVPRRVRARVPVQEDDGRSATPGPDAQLDAVPDIDPRLVEPLEEDQPGQPDDAAGVVDGSVTCRTLEIRG